MKYMVQMEVSVEAAAKFEMGEGPGAFVGYLTEKFRPDAMYFGLDRRSVFIIVDLDETSMAQLMVLGSHFSGSHAQFSAVAPLATFGELAQKAISVISEAPLPK